MNRRNILSLIAIIAITVGGFFSPNVVLADPPSVSHIRIPFIGEYNMAEACLNPSSNPLHDDGAGYAIDASLPIGTPIYAPVNGTVSSVSTTDRGGYGISIVIQDGEGLFTRLAHLSKLYVTSGTVTQDQLIAQSGDSGEGPAHLHWHVQSGSNEDTAVPVNLDPVENVNVTNCNNTVVGTATGLDLSSNPYNWCPTFAAQGYNQVVLFDHKNCKGNMKVLNYETGAVLADFNDRTRSIYVPPGKSVFVSANSDGNGGWFCASEDKWNLDVDSYLDNSNHVMNKKMGWQGGDGYNMISYAIASNSSNCTINGTSIINAQIGGTLTGMFLWLNQQNNNLLDDFGVSEELPFDFQFHVRVNHTGGTDAYDAMQLCVHTTCFETSEVEHYWNWNTYGWDSGVYDLKIRYRTMNDSGNWANAEVIHDGDVYLSPIRAPYAPCSANVSGVELTSGSDCVIVTDSVSDLSRVGWADRSNAYATVSEGLEAWIYDSVEFGGAATVIKDGQTGPVGGSVSSVKFKTLSEAPPSNPTGPFTADANTVHLWHMNEFDGGTIHDAVGTLNGTKTDAVGWITSDLGSSFDKALLFPNIPTGRGITFPVMENICPFTWEGWISAPSESLGGNVAGQLAGGGNTGVNKWKISVNNRRPQAEVWSGGGSQIAYSYKEVVSGAWNYLMFTYDCNNSVKLYLNNELVGEVTTAGVWSSTPTTYEIGSTEGIYRYYGAIDEVRISNTVRVPTAEDIWDGGLVPNGSFESLSSGWANNWTRNNTNSVVIDTGSNGTHGSNSLRFLYDTSNHSAFSAEMPVSSANSYIWLSRVRSTAGSGEFGFYIDEYDSGHNWISGQWFSALPASVEGTKIISYRPTNSSVSYANLQYYMNANTSYEVYVDSVSFTQSASSNLVTNGGFEYLLSGWADGWTRDNTSLVNVSTSSQGNEGSNSLHFAPTSGNTHAYGTRFPVGSGTYTWSQYVVSTTGTGEFGFYIDEFDANGNWISGQWKGGIWGASSGVQSFTYTRSSSNVAFASPQLYALGGTTFDVYVDSVTFGQ